MAAATSLRPFSLSRRIFNASLYQKVRHVWFDDLPADTAVPPQKYVFKWFGRGTPEELAQFDKTCQSEFRSALDAIGPVQYPLPAVKNYESERELCDAIAAPFLGECGVPNGASRASESSAEEGHRNALSLILLLDQMPRNIYRDEQAVIYNHYDRIGRALLHSFLKSNFRPDLHPEWRRLPAFRSWFYMPLMHSEFPEDHILNEKLLREMAEETKADGDDVTDYNKLTIGFAAQHADIIKKFGRYPHRNAHLGREMTADETSYLENGGQKF